MTIDSNLWAAVAAIGQIIAAIVAIVAVVIACRTANSDKRISIAPQRAIIYRAYALLGRHLVLAVDKINKKDIFTEDEIRTAFDEWLCGVEDDEEYRYLVRQRILTAAGSGFSISFYKKIVPELDVVFKDAMFYFDENVCTAIKEMLCLLRENEVCIPNPVDEIDARKALKGMEVKICAQMNDVIVDYKKAIVCMSNQMKIAG